MKPVNVALAAVAAPLALALPTELAERQAAQPRVQIDPALYPVLQRYTRFAVASLATFTYNLGRCPSPPFKSKLVKTIVNLVTDTQAAIFRDDNAKELILSLPGTSSVQDFLTDFVFIPLDQTTAAGCTDCRVHGGFYVAWRSIADQVTTALADLRAKNPGYSIVITGHSLGGALATLAYTDLKAVDVPVKIAYTMGSPRVGNPAYANFVDRLSGASDSNLGTMIRITHNTDGVPGLPSQAMGFQHSRTEIYELDNAAGKQSLETTFRCYGQEAPDCNKATATGFINQDHLVYTGIQMTNGAECANAN
ncbi:alpha/beta-hydrolase [Didymella exigua CBS 183.55]|uniref:Alpha/beta-hydrolase n=1 Tax=Didymella exigua CBS 183.55 TaxID=1150837 RepID=A0A6A5RTB5_9PLEO|nr:alpha/beta-hydrolase [Didymella exigua CBS 183.55]KAF1930394.1 alpha/beta-hydrolase [Didymella exigua CBS 183.55]